MWALPPSHRKRSLGGWRNRWSSRQAGARPAGVALLQRPEVKMKQSRAAQATVICRLRQRFAWQFIGCVIAHHRRTAA